MLGRKRKKDEPEGVCQEITSNRDSGKEKKLNLRFKGVIVDGEIAPNGKPRGTSRAALGCSFSTVRVPNLDPVDGLGWCYPV